MTTAHRILVLPGALWQVPLVQRIRALGHSPLVVHPSAEGPALAGADGHLQADLFDFERILDYARAQGVRAVLSDQCDLAVPVVARLAARLGLPGIGQDMARLYTHKPTMRAFLRRHGLPCPEHALCRTAAEVERFLAGVGGPIVVKPLDANSSRGVRTVSQPAEVASAFAEALAYSRAERAVLAERRIRGPEFTVEGLKTPSRHYTLAISRKEHYAQNGNVARRLSFSAADPEVDYDQLRAVHDALVERTGLPFGITHAEYKHEDGTFYLVEMAARGSGNLVPSHVVPFLTGVDPYALLLAWALGEAPDPDLAPALAPSGRAAALQFIDLGPRTGTVAAVHGEQFMDGEPRVLAWKLHLRPGDPVAPVSEDSKRAGFYIVGAETLSELNDLERRIGERFAVTVG